MITRQTETCSDWGMGFLGTGQPIQPDRALAAPSPLNILPTLWASCLYHVGLFSSLLFPLPALFFALFSLQPQDLIDLSRGEWHSWPKLGPSSTFREHEWSGEKVSGAAVVLLLKAARFYWLLDLSFILIVHSTPHPSICEVPPLPPRNASTTPPLFFFWLKVVTWDQNKLNSFRSQAKLTSNYAELQFQVDCFPGCNEKPGGFQGG